jgi:hypothetical protein
LAPFHDHRDAPAPRLHPELTWLDYAETFRRIGLWQTSVGMLYAATDARDPYHIEVGYRVEVIASGTVLGYHPELGSVHHVPNYGSTTRISAVAELESWMNLDGSPMRSDRPLPL